MAADWITAISSALMFVTSVGMYWVGWRNYKLYEQAQQQADQQQKNFEDLLEAMVISTLISGPSSTGGFEGAIVAFKSKYLGNRKIFKETESAYEKHGIRHL